MLISLLLLRYLFFLVRDQALCSSHNIIGPLYNWIPRTTQNKNYNNTRFVKTLYRTQNQNKKQEMQKPPQIKKETKPISKWNCMGETRPETGPNQVNNNSSPNGPLLVRRLDSKVLPHSLFEFKFRFKFFFFFFLGIWGFF